MRDVTDNRINLKTSVPGPKSTQLRMNCWKLNKCLQWYLFLILKNHQEIIFATWTEIHFWTLSCRLLQFH